MKQLENIAVKGNGKRFNITQWCQERIRQMTDQPTRCIDATAGTGKDTLFLCSLIEGGGELLAMDIQEEALEKTADRLEAHGFVREMSENPDDTGRNRQQQDIRIHPDLDSCHIAGSYLKNRTEVCLIRDGHERLDRYAKEESADIIMFNLGYLPGGDHGLATKAETTLMALEKSLHILKTGGLLSLIIYSGGDSGFEERDQVLAWLKTLDVSRYLVLVECFYNRPNHPPLPVFIQKL